MNFKNGFYTVDNKIFQEKLDAILYANQFKKEVEWVFHNEKFNSLNWTIEPELSLDDFYRIRAQQIRDYYDYVIILCSGGADSTNVVYSFLNNGIHVDEVIASAPVSGLNLWKSNNIDNHANNTMSETELVQIPLMAEIKQKFPNVKITINDYFDNLLSYKTDDWIFRCGEWIHPTSASRYDLSKLVHIRNLAEQGKKIGIVYGIDKPTLIYDVDGSVLVSISDLAVNVQRPPFEEKYDNVENVLFYWSDQLPELIAKQAHVLNKWLKLPFEESTYARQHVRDLAKPMRSFESNRIRQSTYERAIVPCIYPSTKREIFQGHKPTRMFLGEHDNWFYSLHKNTRLYQLIESDFRNFIKNIDPMYLNPIKTGFKLYSHLYKIC